MHDHLMLDVTAERERESERERDRDRVQTKYFISEFEHLLGFFLSIKVFISKGIFLQYISF